MKKLSLIILPCILFIACSTQHSQEKRWLISYSESLYNFAHKDWLHFPFDFTNYSNKRIFVYPEGASKYNLKAGLILDTRAIEAYFKEYYNILDKQNFTRFSILNDSIFFIGANNDDVSCKKSVYPIPDFLIYMMSLE